MVFYALETLYPGKMTNLIFGLYSYKIKINNIYIYIYLSRTKAAVSNIVFTVICQIGMNFESYSVFPCLQFRQDLEFQKKKSVFFYCMIFRFITCAVNIKKKENRGGLSILDTVLIKLGTYLVVDSISFRHQSAKRSHN